MAIEALSVHGSDNIEMFGVFTMAWSTGSTVTDAERLRIVFQTTHEWRQPSQFRSFDTCAENCHLSVSQDSADVVAPAFAADIVGGFQATKTLKQIIAPGSLPTVRATSIPDQRAVILWGVMEDFHGNPWTDRSCFKHFSILGHLTHNVFANVPEIPEPAGSVRSGFIDHSLEVLKQ